MFQFQTGSIRSEKNDQYNQLAHGGFNSKLVRLEDVSLEDLEAEYRGFNSKLVRLEGKMGSFKKDVFGVSIPNWFD